MSEAEVTWDDLDIPDMAERYRLAKVGMTPQEVRDYGEAGITDRGQMVRLKQSTVHGHVAKGYAEQGITEYEEMVKLRRERIDPAAYKALKEMIPEGTIEDVIRFRRLGASKGLVASLRRIGITHPIAIEDFAKSRTTAKDVDEYRKAGCKPEDIYDPVAGVKRPNINLLILRRTGEEHLVDYVPSQYWGDIKASISDRAMERARLCYQHGVDPDWSRTERDPAWLIELWDCGEPRPHTHDFNDIITFQNHLEVSMQDAHLLWVHAEGWANAVCDVIRNRYVDGGGMREAIAKLGVQGAYEATKHCVIFNSDQLRKVFDPPSGKGSLWRQLRAQEEAVGNHNPEIWRLWFRQAWEKFSRDDGQYPDAKWKAQFLTYVEVFAKTGVTPSEYEVLLRKLGVDHDDMRDVVERSKTITFGGEITPEMLGDPDEIAERAYFDWDDEIEDHDG